MLRVLFGRQPKRYLGGFPIYSLLYFTVLLKQLQRLYIGGFIFQVLLVYNYSTCCTDRVLTRLVHQVRVYAFGAPTTYLRVQGTYKALTNQGEVYQYVNHIVCFNTKDSHYYLKEHTILYIFHAPRSNSLVPLNQYKQYYIKTKGELKKS